MKDYAEVATADAEKFAKEHDLSFFECAAVRVSVSVCLCLHTHTHSHTQLHTQIHTQATANHVDAPFVDIATKFHANYEEQTKAVASL